MDLSGTVYSELIDDRKVRIIYASTFSYQSKYYGVDILKHSTQPDSHYVFI